MTTNNFRKQRPWYRPLEYAKRRCTDENHRAYGWYGGRGIKCFLNYAQAKIVYEISKGHLLKRPSLDRLDPDGHYCFCNCRYIEHVDNVARRRPNGEGKNNIEDLCCKNPNEGDWT